jgi:hypothetical protein
LWFRFGWLTIESGGSIRKASKGPKFSLHMQSRLSGDLWTLQRRYRDFERLLSTLVSGGFFYLHALPPKPVQRTLPALLERAEALQVVYCNELLRRSDARSACPVATFFTLEAGVRKAVETASHAVRTSAALALQSAARRRRARVLAARRLLAFYSLQTTMRNAHNECGIMRLRLELRQRDGKATRLQAAWRSLSARRERATRGAELCAKRPAAEAHGTCTQRRPRAAMVDETTDANVAPRVRSYSAPLRVNACIPSWVDENVGQALGFGTAWALACAEPLTRIALQAWALLDAM